MPNNCCVCGIKMGKMQQYYQLSKNHPEEHLCPDCAQEIQTIYDLANGADPDFRRHMRRFSEKMESGTSSGAAIGYLEHFFQNCSRLYRDQLMKASAEELGQRVFIEQAETDLQEGWIAETAQLDAEEVHFQTSDQEELAYGVPEKTDVSIVSENEELVARSTEANLNSETAESGEEQIATADPGARIKRIGSRRRETTEEPETDQGTNLEATEQDRSLEEAEAQVISFDGEDRRENIQTETSEERNEKEDLEREKSQRNMKSKNPNDSEKKHPISDMRDERGRFFEKETKRPKRRLLYILAWVFPFVSGAAGGFISFFSGSSLLCTVICAACGFLVGLIGTACVLAIEDCLEQVSEVMDMIRESGFQTRQ